MPAYGHREITFTIANGQSLSDAQQLNGIFAEAIRMPAAWTTAGISFAVADSAGGTFLPVEDALGIEATVTVAASQFIILPLGMLRAGNWVKLQSGTSTVPVNQSAQRQVTLVCRSYE